MSCRQDEEATDLLAPAAASESGAEEAARLPRSWRILRVKPVFSGAFSLSFCRGAGRRRTREEESSR